MNTSLLCLVPAALIGAAVTVFCLWWPDTAPMGSAAAARSPVFGVTFMGAVFFFTAILIRRPAGARSDHLADAGRACAFAALFVLTSQWLIGRDGPHVLPMFGLGQGAAMALAATVTHRSRAGESPWSSVWGVAGALASGAAVGAFLWPGSVLVGPELWVVSAALLALGAVWAYALQAWSSGVEPDDGGPVSPGFARGASAVVLGFVMASAVVVDGWRASPRRLPTLFERADAWSERLMFAAVLCGVAWMLLGRSGRGAAGRGVAGGGRPSTRATVVLLGLVLVGAEVAVLVDRGMNQADRHFSDVVWETESDAEALALAKRMGRVSASLAPESRRSVVLASAKNIHAMDEGVRGGVEALAGASVQVRGPDVVADASFAPFDLFVCAPVTPWRATAGRRLSLEHFEAIRRVLTDDGLAVVWLPLDRMTGPALESVTATFLAAFPEARAVLATPLADAPMLALVGGRSRLPGVEALDALLSEHPDPLGPHDALDVLGLVVADAWVMREAVGDAPISTRARPHAELLSLPARDRPGLAAAANLRLLAGWVQPLDPTSLRRVPSESHAVRALANALGARAELLASLMRARAARLELLSTSADPLPDADLWRDEHERTGLADALDGALLAAWDAAPGHPDARAAILERAAWLQAEDDLGRMGFLLEAALADHGDVALAGLYGGVLLLVGRDETALGVLERARPAAPGDRTILAHLGSAQARLGRDEEARATLHAARAAFGEAPFPPVPAVVLGLLEGDANARQLARAMLDRLEPGNPWAPTLERLLADG